jgi:hypothetical protein
VSGAWTRQRLTKVAELRSDPVDPTVVTTGEEFARTRGVGDRTDPAGGRSQFGPCVRPRPVQPDAPVVRARRDDVSVRSIGGHALDRVSVRRMDRS